MAPCWNCIKCDSEERGFIRPGSPEQVGPTGRGGATPRWPPSCVLVLGSPWDPHLSPSSPVIWGPAQPCSEGNACELAFHYSPGPEFPFYSQKQSFAIVSDPTMGHPELKTSSLWADKFLMQLFQHTHSTCPGSPQPRTSTPVVCVCALSVHSPPGLGGGARTPRLVVSLGTRSWILSKGWELPLMVTAGRKH